MLRQTPVKNQTEISVSIGLIYEKKLSKINRFFKCNHTAIQRVGNTIKLHDSILMKTTLMNRKQGVLTHLLISCAGL